MMGNSLWPRGQWGLNLNEFGRGTEREGWGRVGVGVGEEGLVLEGLVWVLVWVGVPAGGGELCPLQQMVSGRNLEDGDN